MVRVRRAWRGLAASAALIALAGARPACAGADSREPTGAAAGDARRGGMDGAIAGAEAPDEPGGGTPEESDLRQARREPATAEIVSPESEGQRELAAASGLLRGAEQASGDAERRARYADAERRAERAASLLPRSAEARFVHFAAAGRLAQLDGLAAAALQYMRLNAELDEVLRLDPNHAAALAARGGILVKLPRLLGGNTQRGIEYLERAVALDRSAVGKRLELAEAYHIVGREDEAQRTAEQALATAEEEQDPARVETCKRFIAELRTACRGCAMAAIGR